jgi:hypothetical protein
MFNGMNGIRDRGKVVGKDMDQARGARTKANAADE